MTDRDQLLKAFNLGPEDLDACRAGRLGPGQIRRLMSSGRTDIASAIFIGVALVAILLLVADKPLKPVQWIMAGGLFAAVLAAGMHHSRKMQAAVADGRVECLTGEVEMSTRGRTGWWLTVSGRSFRLPVRPWKISGGERYRVYVSPRANQIVGMEPDA